jgi:hypothetical protein
MASTKITAAMAKACMRQLVKSRRLATIVFKVTATAAKANITLPLYLDLTYACPILSLKVDTDLPKTKQENYQYCLINAAGTSDQVVLTAAAGDQPAAGEFMVGSSAGALAGNIIILGDATTAASIAVVYTLTAVFRVA